MTTFYDRPYIKPEPEPGSEFSSRAAALLAAEEQSGGDIAALKKAYNPLPQWPKGGSGLTSGLGSELGPPNATLRGTSRPAPRTSSADTSASTDIHTSRRRRRMYGTTRA